MKKDWEEEKEREGEGKVCFPAKRCSRSAGIALAFFKPNMRKTENRGEVEEDAEEEEEREEAL